MTLSSSVASDSTHWYGLDGSPAYEVAAKDGTMRATTLRDARKLRLVPSVTTISGILAKPGLQKWLQEQAIDAALTLPRIEGESLQQFKERAIADAAEQSKKARDRGTDLHTAIELYLQGRPYDTQWEPHVNAVKAACRDYGIDLHDGEAERSFAHPLGFGGKVDFHSKSQGWVLDWKSKQNVSDTKKLAWPEHAVQLSAYREGLLMPEAAVGNVFVGVEDAQAVLIVHDVDVVDAGWQQFQAMLTLWKLLKGYDPCAQ